MQQGLHGNLKQSNILCGWENSMFNHNHEVGNLKVIRSLLNFYLFVKSKI